MILQSFFNTAVLLILTGQSYTHDIYLSFLYLSVLNSDTNLLHTSDTIGIKFTENTASYVTLLFLR